MAIAREVYGAQRRLYLIVWYFVSWICTSGLRMQLIPAMIYNAKTLPSSYSVIHMHMREQYLYMNIASHQSWYSKLCSDIASWASLFMDTQSVWQDSLKWYLRGGHLGIFECCNTGLSYVPMTWENILVSEHIYCKSCNTSATCNKGYKIATHHLNTSGTPLLKMEWWHLPCLEPQICISLDLPGISQELVISRACIVPEYSDCKIAVLPMPLLTDFRKFVQVISHGSKTHICIKQSIQRKAKYQNTANA